MGNTSATPFGHLNAQAQPAPKNQPVHVYHHSRMADCAGGSDRERRSTMAGHYNAMDYSGANAGYPADTAYGPTHVSAGAGCGSCGPCGASRPSGMGCISVVPDDPADSMPEGPAFNDWPCSTRDNAFDNKDPRGDPHGRPHAPGKTSHTFAHAATDYWTDPRYGDTTHPGHVQRQYHCAGAGRC